MTTSTFAPVHLDTRVLRSPVGEVALSLPRALLVFGAAVLCHAWFLRLPFQLDDYGLLADPFSLLSASETEAGLTARLLRLPLIGLLGVLRALAPEPLVPLHFHLVGLILHGTTAMVLARCVSRFERTLEISGAAVLAGLLFGLGGGHIQAVSWTSAWASMLYPLFGLLSLDSFLGARARNGSGRRLLQGGLWLYLALVCKAPAVVMAGGMALFLFGLTVGGQRNSGGMKRLWSEGVTFVFFGGLAVLTRYLVFGTIELSYYDRASPSALEALGSIPRGLAAIGQALVPWNAKAMFEGSEPFSVALTEGQLSGVTLAGIAFLPIVLLALWASARLRGPLLLLIVTLLVCAIPPGLVYQGASSNLIGRTTYLAMLVATSILGIGVAGIAARSRWLGSFAALWLLAFAIDGTLHVSRVERLAGEHRTACVDLVRSLSAELAAGPSGAEMVVLVVEDEAGYGSIPSFGPRIVSALRPPFVSPPGWQGHVFRDGYDLLERSAELDLARAQVVVIGPELDAEKRPRAEEPGLGGEPMRARRAWRRLSGPFVDHVPVPGSAVFEPVSEGRWVAAHPIQPHMGRTLHVEVDPAGLGEATRLEGTLWIERAVDPPLGFPTRAPLEEAGATFELPFAPADLLASAWTSMRWEARGSSPVPVSITTRAGLPELEYLGVQDLSDLSLGSGRIPRPRLLFRLPPGTTEGVEARLSWNFATRGVRARLFAEAEVSVQDGRFEFSPTRVRLEGPQEADFPWGEFCRRFLIPLFRQGGEQPLELECRLVLLLESGHATARSPAFTLRFEE